MMKENEIILKGIEILIILWVVTFNVYVFGLVIALEIECNICTYEQDHAIVMAIIVPILSAIMICFINCNFKSNGKFKLCPSV